MELKYRVVVVSIPCMCFLPFPDYEPPSFTRDVGVLQVLSGRPILIEVNVLGRPRPDIEWFKNGEACKAFYDEEKHRVSNPKEWNMGFLAIL